MVTLQVGMQLALVHAPCRRRARTISYSVQDVDGASAPWYPKEAATMLVTVSYLARRVEYLDGPQRQQGSNV